MRGMSRRSHHLPAAALEVKEPVAIGAYSALASLTPGPSPKGRGGHSGESGHRFRREAGHRFRSKWTPVGAKRRGELDYEPRWLVWVNARRRFRIDSPFKLSW